MPVHYSVWVGKRMKLDVDVKDMVRNAQDCKKVRTESCSCSCSRLVGSS